jgi:hypothetical protein
MKLTRRNALIGLGSLVAGSGALVGTGAFSSVEADRTVNVETAGDGSALLSFDVTGDLEGSTDDTIAFSLGDGVNLDATTRFNEALDITNNGDDPVSLTIEDGGTSLIGGDTNIEFEVNGSNSGNLGADTTRTYDVVFNLDGVTTQDNATIPDTITITATAA